MAKPPPAADPTVRRRTVSLLAAVGALLALAAALAVPRAAAQPAPPGLTAEKPAPSYSAPVELTLPAAPLLTAPGEEPMAPPLSGTIQGIDLLEDALNNSGAAHIPPDPHGAAGPSHVVSIVNTSIEWHTKAGTQQFSQALQTFFGPVAPVNNTFDPKVIYDQYAGRFVAVTLERTGSTSRILLAVSDDSDPNGAWSFAAFNAVVNIGGNDTWFDYPGFAVDEEAIYITGNMFRFTGGTGTSEGTRLWIVNKTPFYSGGAATFSVHDPFATLTNAGIYGTIQPAHTFGTVPVATIGTWFVQTGLTNLGGDDFIRIIRVNNPLTTPIFDEVYFNLGDIHLGGGLPDAPQLGSAVLIDTGDLRPYNMVWRNNNLYFAFSLVPSSGGDAGEVTAHWVRLETNASGIPILVLDQGNVGGDEIDAGAYTYYPSIAVNSFNTVALGFALSGPNTFAGAYYSGRISTEPAGTMQPVVVMAAGVEPYNRAFGGARVRWGDYTATVVDPADDRTFWIFNEFAAADGGLGDFGFVGEFGRWATRWGNFAFTSPLPVDLVAFSAEREAAGVTLRWTTAAEYEVVGFHLLRSVTGERADAARVTGALLPAEGDAVVGADYSWTDGGASVGTRYSYWLEVVNRSGQPEEYGPVRVLAPAPSATTRIFLPLLR